MHHRSIFAFASLAVLITAAGCAPAPANWQTESPSPLATAAGPRPSSSAVLAITSPTNGESVKGPTVHIAVNLTGATIVSATSTNIRPDQGHIHVYIDNNLVQMNYASTLDETVPVGTHVLRAEFVASDHAPFNPRVVTADVVFTVTP